MLQKKSFIFTALFLSILLCVLPAYSAPKDGVLSENIAEADGTTGQDTEIGTGVKTGHIQDGAVTDAKIAGPISASKIDTLGLDADTVDGLHASDLRQKADNVIIVAKNGGDYTSPITAMASITDASSSNPYLVIIMPGTYDLGTAALTMKPFVFIEGSGQELTTIKTAKNHAAIFGGNNAGLKNLTVINYGTGSNIQSIGIFNNNCSMLIDNVTAIAQGAYSSNVGIFEYTGASSVIKNSTAIATAVGTGAYIGATGLAITTNCNTTLENVTAEAYGNEGSYIEGMTINTNSYPVMKNVTAKANSSGGTRAMGIAFSSNAVQMAYSDLTAEATGATENISIYEDWNTIVTLDRAKLTGDLSLYTSSILKIALSQVDGDINGKNNGQLSCFNIYDKNMAPVSCP